MSVTAHESWQGTPRRAADGRKVGFVERHCVTIALSIVVWGLALVMVILSAILGG